MSVKIWLYDLYNMYSSLYICSFDLALVTFCTMLNIFILFACIAFCMLSDLGGNKISYLTLNLSFRCAV